MMPPPKTCPYHGQPQPCRECLIKRMGEFAHYKPRVGSCPYHGKAYPCIDCLDQKRGEFAHGKASKAPSYVPPHRRKPIHLHQTRKDTCAIMCCAMVGANLDCPTEFSLEELEKFMTDKGVYLPGERSLFHALGHVFDWLGLRSRMHERASRSNILDMVRGGSLVVLETSGHVIVIFSENVDGSLVIGDPAMFNVEMQVDPNDYRLNGTGRVWEIRR